MRRPARKLTPEQSEIAGRIYPLALAVSGPYMRAWPRMADEVESGAGLAAIEAAREDDPDGKVVSKAHFKAREALSRTSRGFRIHRILPETGHPLDSIPACEPDFDDERLASAIDRIPPRRWEAIEIAVALGLGTGEAGRRMGIAPKRVHDYIAKGIRQLRTLME